MRLQGDKFDGTHVKVGGHIVIMDNTEWPSEVGYRKSDDIYGFRETLPPNGSYFQNLRWMERLLGNPSMARNGSYELIRLDDPSYFYDDGDDEIFLKKK